MSQKNPCCLLIDPYVSTKMVCETLHKKGIRCIALFTYHEIFSESALARFKLSVFDKVIHLSNENREDVLRELEQEKVDFIQAGREYSVNISDEIAMKLCSKYANSPSTSFQRMNKYEMQEAVRKAGLRATMQHKIPHAWLSQKDIEELKKFHFPVIVKPMEASGSLGVKVCATIEDIQLTLKEVSGKKTPLGSEVLGVVVQELLKGDEYIVDSISLQGNHLNTCVFRYGKTLHHQIPIYRYVDVLNFESKEAKLCSEYIQKSLRAIGLNNGLSHAELFLSPEGACLVEINPRVSGLYGFLNHVARCVFGMNQVDVLAEIIKDKEAMLAFISKQFKARCHSRIIIVQNFHPKTLDEFNSKSLLQSLVSYDQHQSFIQAGQEHSGAKVLSDAIAYISLVHSNPKQIEEDSQKIWHWEKEGLLF